MVASAIDRNDAPYPMFSFFKRKSKDTLPEAADAQPMSLQAEPAAVADTAPAAVTVIEPAQETAETRATWMKRLKAGLSKTSSGLTTLFVGARIDEELYEELEAALLMADAGVEATQFLL